MFLLFTGTQDMRVHFMTVSLTMAWAQSFDDKAVFVFVGDANAHHSVWLVSVSPTDQYGPDALDFCNPSGCELLVCCPTHLLVMDVLT